MLAQSSRAPRGWPARRLALAFFLLFTGALSADDKADADLKALTERVGKEAPERLVRDINAFRIAHAGQPQAAQAAALLRRLPSVLDKLKAEDIPEIEHFLWQPKDLVGVIGQHLGRHGNPVAAVAFAPDGSFAVSGGGPYVRLWAPDTMRLRVLYPIGLSVSSVAVRHDSKAIVFGTYHGTMTVLDVVGPEQVAVRFHWSASTSAVNAVAWTPDGKGVVGGCANNETHIFDVSGKKQEETAVVTGHDKSVAAVAVSPDGKWLATGSLDQTVRLWVLGEEAIPKEKAQLPHPAAITALAFAPGKETTTVASACADGTLRLWPIPVPAKPMPRLAIPQPKDAGAVTCLTFSASGRTLVAGYGDAVVRFWSLANPAVPTHKLVGHAGGVTGVAYAPDNKTMLTGSADWTVRSWDVSRNDKVEQRFQPWSHLSHVYAVAFNPEGTALASGGVDTVLSVWDMTRPKLDKRQYHPDRLGKGVAIHNLAYSPDGKFLAVGGVSVQLRALDPITGAIKLTFPGFPGATNHMHYSLDGKRLLAASGKTVIVFDALKPQERPFIFDGHETLVWGAAFTADGSHVLTGTGAQKLDELGKPVVKDGQPVWVDPSLRMWELATGKENKKAMSSPVYSVAVSPDGKEAFTGQNEPLARRWKVGAGELTPLEGELKGAVYYPTPMTFSPDGTQLVTRYMDGRMILWDVAKGTRIREWTTIPENIGHVAFSPDGRYLAVSLGTGVIYILRLAAL
jgi:WD40 repeat protein